MCQLHFSLVHEDYQQHLEQRQLIYSMNLSCHQNISRVHVMLLIHVLDLLLFEQIHHNLEQRYPKIHAELLAPQDRFGDLRHYQPRSRQRFWSRSYWMTTATVTPRSVCRMIVITRCAGSGLPIRICRTFALGSSSNASTTASRIPASVRALIGASSHFHSSLPNQGRRTRLPRSVIRISFTDWIRWSTSAAACRAPPSASTTGNAQPAPSGTGGCGGCLRTSSGKSPSRIAS